jgi:THO complex subunit 1
VPQRVEKSKKRKLGELEASEEASEGDKAKAAEDDAKAPALDYKLYQVFWGLQERLANPKQVTESAAAFTGFADEVRAVLQAFEAFGASTSTSAHGPSPPAASAGGAPSPKRPTKSKRASMAVAPAGSGGGDDKAGVAMGCKYLTNSRLFRLQLQDPLVRLQVLTQVEIALSFAEWELRDRDKDKAFTEAETLLQLMKQVSELIQNTPSGTDYLPTLFKSLEREEGWRDWKKTHGCKEFERPQGPDAKDVKASERVKQAVEKMAVEPGNMLRIRP